MLSSICTIKGMATPFDLPNLDSEQDRVRALGVKELGREGVQPGSVFPVNRLNSQDGLLKGLLADYGRSKGSVAYSSHLN